MRSETAGWRWPDVALRNLDRHVRRLQEKVEQLDVPDNWADVAGRFVAEREDALTDAQREIYDDDSRYRVVIAGRRYGKTFVGVSECLTRAVREPDTVCWLVSPSFQQGRETAWKELKRLVPRDLLDGAPHETYMDINLQNGSEVGVRSADKPDSLRGRGIDFAVLDEFVQMEESVWTEVIRPSLSDRGGDALFISTPRGHNWAFDLFDNAEQQEEWSAFSFTTLDGGLVPEEEVEAAREALSESTFKQEYEASFESPAGRVYSNFSPLSYPDGNVDDEVEDTGGELLVGMDFNVNPMSAVVAKEAGDECHVLDDIELMSSSTREMASELKARYEDRKIIVYPDPSGRARKTSAPVGETDFTILKRAGFTVRAPSSAPLVVDRINNTQAMLCNAEGRRRVRIRPDAQALIRCLGSLAYREGTSQPDKNSGLDHLPDALGYLLWERFNQLKRKTISVERFAIV